MADFLPDHPPPEVEFKESEDDESCPECGWSVDEALLDPLRARDEGVLLAIENAEGSPFSAAGGTQVKAYYWQCPDAHFFTTEGEQFLGGMA